MRSIASLLSLVLLAVACGSDPPAARPEGTVGPSPAPTVAPLVPTVRFAAVGDIGEGNETQERVGERIAALNDAQPIDVLLLLGDIIYPDGAGHRYEDRFAEPWAPVLDAGIRMEAALGNHDVQTRDGADVMELFEKPGRYHAFEIGPVAFFALDGNRIDAEQLDWLDRRLGATDLGWKVLFLHQPPYSSGMHGSMTHVRDALAPLIAAHGVQLVLAGHDHDYERTHPIEGTVYVVAGIGCCLREMDRSDFTAAAASRPGVVVFEATPDRMTLSAVDADGTVFDTAEIVAADRRATESPAA